MKKFEPYQDWTTEFLQYGVFDHLNSLFGIEKNHTWPTLFQLNQYATGITQCNGLQIEFIAQDDIDWQHGYYEEVIYKTGHIPTRLNNWHDLFGAFIWLLFPKTKAFLNALHVHDINQFGNKERTSMRNAITLFDECGVVIPFIDNNLPNYLQEHEWDNAFVTNRAEWGHRIDAYMFGHANYEMATRPFLGLTGKALYLAVHHEFFELPLKSRYAYLDNLLVNQIQEKELLKDNQNLYPMPFLGIPTWYDGNKDSGFYQNTAYFRPKRRKTL